MKPHWSRKLLKGAMAGALYLVGVSVADAQDHSTRDSQGE